MSGSPTINSGNSFLLSGLPANFYWTATTLNGTTNIANLILKGTATGLIAPADGGNVNTGDNFTLGGGVVIINPGTLTATNPGMQFNINCTCEIDPSGSSQGTVYWDSVTSVGPTTTVKGYLVIVNGTYSTSGNIANQGQVSIYAGCDLICSSVRLKNGSTLVAYSQTSGYTYMGASSVLKTDAAGWIVIANSGLYYDWTAADQNITISTGSFHLNKGGLLSPYPQTTDTHYFGTILISGDMSWGQGVFAPAVEGEGAGSQSDVLDVSGTLTLAEVLNQADVGLLDPIGYDGENNPADPDPGKSFLVVDAMSINGPGKFALVLGVPWAKLSLAGNRLFVKS